MPGNPHECRENANRCLEMAEGSATQTAREKFDTLARIWLALATDYEASNLLLANWRALPAEQGLVAPLLCREAEQSRDT
jgi:hypothetical protein